jgi:hypothetical protein
VQCSPEHLGECVRILFVDDEDDRLAQLGEGRRQRRRCVFGGEAQGGRTGEHRVVDRGVVAPEVDVGVCDAGQDIAGGAGVGTGGPNRIGELAEPIHGDGIGDFLHAREVLVQDRLAVFDLGRQSTGGDGIPAFGLGQTPGRCDDQASASGTLTCTAIIDGHTR